MDLLYNWLIEIQNSPHLTPLLKSKNLQICIKSNDQIAYIIIQKGEIFLKEEAGSESHICIDCHSDSLNQLLKGEVKLRQAMCNNLLIVRGSLRQLLFTESLFWLGSVPFRSQLV